MGRYDDEIAYDRKTINGKIRKALTFRVIDREYNEEESIIHIVKDKETLFDIATLYYDDFRKWYIIADKNIEVTNPFSLSVGMQLVVPSIDNGGVY